MQVYNAWLPSLPFASGTWTLYSPQKRGNNLGDFFKTASKHIEIYWWNSSRKILSLPYAGIFFPQSSLTLSITVAFSCLEQANHFLFNTSWLQCPGEKGPVSHGHYYLLLNDFSPKNRMLVSALSWCNSCFLALSLHLTHPNQQVYFHIL